jgi:radical SAM-linked protein
MTQPQTERVTARVEYAKRGRLRFIGHLDTVRLITRAVRAAGLPVQYTKGCSPHLELSPGPPLPVGTSGEREFFDVRLAEPVDPGAVRDALQSHMPEGIAIHGVRLIVGKTASLGVYLNRADYVVDVAAGSGIGRDAIERLMASDEAVVVRTRPGGDKSVNVRRFVERLDVAEGPDGSTRLEMTIVMTPDGSTNPSEVLAALRGGEADERSHPVRWHPLRVHRVRTYHVPDSA